MGGGGEGGRGSESSLSVYLLIFSPPRPECLNNQLFPPFIRHVCVLFEHNMTFKNCVWEGVGRGGGGLNLLCQCIC